MSLPVHKLSFRVSALVWLSLLFTWVWVILLCGLKQQCTHEGTLPCLDTFSSICQDIVRHPAPAWSLGDMARPAGTFHLASQPIVAVGPVWSYPWSSISYRCFQIFLITSYQLKLCQNNYVLVSTSGSLLQRTPSASIYRWG